MNINKVLVCGNITKDPELKALPTGSNVANFTVATNENYKDRNGNKIEKAEFHRIVAFGNTAQNIAQYMKKGSQIFIEGKLQTRSWEVDDGSKRYMTEIIASNVQFGAKRSQSNAEPQQRNQVDLAYDEIGKSGINKEEYEEGEINHYDIPF